MSTGWSLFSCVCQEPAAPIYAVSARCRPSTGRSLFSCVSQEPAALIFAVSARCRSALGGACFPVSARSLQHLFLLYLRGAGRALGGACFPVSAKSLRHLFLLYLRGAGEHWVEPVFLCQPGACGTYFCCICEVHPSTGGGACFPVSARSLRHLFLLYLRGAGRALGGACFPVSAKSLRHLFLLYLQGASEHWGWSLFSCVSQEPAAPIFAVSARCIRALGVEPVFLCQPGACGTYFCCICEVHLSTGWSLFSCGSQEPAAPIFAVSVRCRPSTGWSLFSCVSQEPTAPIFAVSARCLPSTGWSLFCCVCRGLFEPWVGLVVLQMPGT
ncbi:hypothetical protein NDU88_007081 [Pleurodeles waltl]|uniref:Uncharacterized protein n=1 Tax=Pleurodeles waltl TaxID=8319 RepID=A0AAV7MEY5_PLEWA|nr:hypothetical protein NDU88_007081 [Pleurodeles waltl]